MVRAEKVHGKPIDVTRFKQPVLRDLHKHVKEVKRMVGYLSRYEKPMRQQTCYICGSRRRKPFAHVHGFKYVQCMRCTHVYTDRRYSEEALERFYKKSRYYSQITYANRETCFYRRDHIARPKVEFVERFFFRGRRRKPGTWLDVGSGIGDAVSVLLNKDWDAQGLEISESSVAFAKEAFGVSLRAQTFDAYVKEHGGHQNTFDVVSFIAILEHVPDPVRYLSMAHELLDKRGLVVVQEPNARSLSCMIQEVFSKHVFRHMVPTEHIMLFTEQSLTTALARTGFRPLAWWYHGLDMYELLTQLMLLNPRVKGSAFYEAWLSNLNELQLVFDERELSDRLICVAQKR